MTGSMEPMDPADLRISHADREKVAEVLREAAGDGRIDLDELDERLDATWKAKTYRDLVPITVDLPGHGPAPAPHPEVSLDKSPSAPVRRSPAGAAPTYDASLAVMTETKRRGVWDIGSQHSATAMMGSVVLDLREARFPVDGEVVITANAVMGGVEIIVDARTEVRVDGVGIMGSFAEGRARVSADLDAASPRVRVTGFALMGSVEVKRRGAPGELGRTVRKQLGF